MRAMCCECVCVCVCVCVCTECFISTSMWVEADQQCVHTQISRPRIQTMQLQIAIAQSNSATSATGPGVAVGGVPYVHMYDGAIQCVPNDYVFAIVSCDV